ncbi:MULTISPECIES: hypothetical protein [Pseudomonas]|uniref:hypothetical protein n=1 Tax=Pseudomonas TaxID=286 RepID=UPI00053D2D1F|nr:MULTISPECIES: hypothetical protein [Pseudomonas]HCL2747156.1 hypothetical protein [Pseudomonas aeruginosa 449A]EKU1368626.1 hypothetical protein [Pseudomonas aeruginosa]ELC7284831.1 hypothetical protein [Pseudomonas aeruginosa]ELM3823595.1 hypothetical protein [Pseudomonas aeruginosa]ELN9534169.1 hypothetical protein [Pseudomonas aeruginosa]
MSQHHFETVHKGFPITVILGWDRSMHYFFLVIRKPAELIDNSAKVFDEDFLYSNLYEKDPFGHSLDYYRAVLRYFLIDVPESMFTEVQQDCAGNVGNRVVKHEANGSFTEQSL